MGCRVLGTQQHMYQAHKTRHAKLGIQYQAQTLRI